MIHRVWIGCLIVAMMLGLVGCEYGGAPTIAAGEGSIGMLVEIEGNISHKRPGWKHYQPLSFGALLDHKDLIQAESGARGKIVCGNLEVVDIPSGYSGAMLCPRGEPTLTRGARESLVRKPDRGAVSDEIPYVLSPRRTALMTSTPILRWHPSKIGYATYTVRVSSSGSDWQVQTTDLELRYPLDAPTLELGSPYHLAVTDSQGRSSLEEKTSLDLNFWLLAPEEQQVIQALITKVQGLGLNVEGAALVTAGIYEDHEVRADAIDLLESVAAQNRRPNVDRWLGDLYWDVGLSHEAIDAYGRAEVGYSDWGDQEGKATALVGRGIVWLGVSERAKAQAYLNEARDIYEALGDTEAANRVKELPKQ